MRLEVHRAARAEMNAAASFYAESDEGVAERFAAEIARVLHEILAHPERWPLHHKSTHRLSLRGFPYNVVYRVHEDRVRVLAVAHMKRAPMYWQGRR